MMDIYMPAYESITIEALRKRLEKLGLLIDEEPPARKED